MEPSAYQLAYSQNNQEHNEFAVYHITDENMPIIYRPLPDALMEYARSDITRGNMLIQKMHLLAPTLDRNGKLTINLSMHKMPNLSYQGFVIYMINTSDRVVETFDTLSRAFKESRIIKDLKCPFEIASGIKVEDIAFKISKENKGKTK